MIQGFYKGREMPKLQLLRRLSFAYHYALNDYEVLPRVSKFLLFASASIFPLMILFRPTYFVSLNESAVTANELLAMPIGMVVIVTVLYFLALGSAMFDPFCDFDEHIATVDADSDNSQA